MVPRCFKSFGIQAFLFPGSFWTRIKAKRPWTRLTLGAFGVFRVSSLGLVVLNGLWGLGLGVLNGLWMSGFFSKVDGVHRLLG